ncbi:MAG: hypothetical protein ABIB43_06880 [archaeon]
MKNVFRLVKIVVIILALIGLFVLLRDHGDVTGEVVKDTITVTKTTTNTIDTISEKIGLKSYIKDKFNDLKEEILH